MQEKANHNAAAKSIKAVLWLLAPLFLLGLALVFGYMVDQSSFVLLASVYLAFFGLFAIIYRKIPPRKLGTSHSFDALSWFILLGVGLRCLLVFALPNLSDDYFRFVWDGRLLVNGLHPLAELPSYYLKNPVEGLDASLYAQLNSKEYFTVYPPFCQSIFALSCWLSPQSVYGSVVVMKSVFLALEIGTIALLLSLLRSFRLAPKSVLLYALNPLVILETFNNLHFEVAMVFFVLLALWLLVKGKWVWAAVAMALGVATKLLPLMFLPFLLRRMDWRIDWKKGIAAVTVGALVLGLLFVPLLSGFAENFGKSLNLYFQRFEFNAGIYYLLRKIGFLLTGYNPIQVIGPTLILVAGLAILAFAYREKNNSWNTLPQMWLLALTLFLLATTTVHPWYLTGLVALSVLTPWRYPTLWSLLIMGTYMNYAGTTYKEQLWWVVLEYSTLFTFISWEFFFKKNGKSFRKLLKPR